MFYVWVYPCFYLHVYVPVRLCLSTLCVLHSSPIATAILWSLEPDRHLPLEMSWVGCRDREREEIERERGRKEVRPANWWIDACRSGVVPDLKRKIGSDFRCQENTVLLH